jgi:hypothetical protein
MRTARASRNRSVVSLEIPGQPKVFWVGRDGRNPRRMQVPRRAPRPIQESVIAEFRVLEQEQASGLWEPFDSPEELLPDFWLDLLEPQPIDHLTLPVPLMTDCEVSGLDGLRH